MNISDNTGEYQLLDSGNGRKLEQFGDYVLSRPCEAAQWYPSLPATKWRDADAAFDPDGSGAWVSQKNIPESWVINTGPLSLKLSPTPVGHIGIFPEQIHAWSWISDSITNSGRTDLSVLNLFAYSGGSTLAAARAGAKVCHLDASKGMTQRARENAELNGLADAPIRWIVDDVTKFMKREIKRGSSYDAIILDPPSFGRGKSGETFKIESAINELLSNCRTLLSPNPLFVYLSCHTPSFTPDVVHELIEKALKGKKGSASSGNLFLTGKTNVQPVPNGTYSIWTSNE